jgi:hypothetical protein
VQGQSAPAGIATPPSDSTFIAFRGDGRSGKANEAAPGQVALSERRTVNGEQVGGRALPGAPLVGADGSVQYDQAWVDKNRGLIDEYAGRNVMPMGTPAPGVAASMVSGGVTPGVISRAPRGFTAEDRAAQADNLDRQGRDYKVRDFNERATRAAKYGDAGKAAALQEAAQTASIAQPPRITPMTRPDPNDATRLAMEQQRLGMDQQTQGLANEQTQVQTQAQQLQLQQAQKMQELQTQMLAGDPAATQQWAKLQNIEPGQPFTSSFEIPISRGFGGEVKTAKVDRRFDARGNRLDPVTPQEQAYIEYMDALNQAAGDPAKTAAIQDRYFGAPQGAQ